MLGISGQPLEAVGDQLAERADILVFRGQNTYRAGIGFPIPLAIPQGGFGQAVGGVQTVQQLGLDGQGFPGPGINGLLVKIGIGDGGKQIQGNEPVNFRGNLFTLGPQGRGDSGQTAGHMHQKILGGGYVRLLAADTGVGAAGAAGGFLTLITKHFLIHTRNSFFRGFFNSWVQYIGRWATRMLEMQQNKN